MTQHQATGKNIRIFSIGYMAPAELAAAVVFSFIGILITSLISYKTLGQAGGAYLVASMGAASVLIFCLPSSPLSQPWPLLGGHIVSAAAGVGCALWITDQSFAAATAVGLAISGMYFFRCLHPPGGAAALGAVLGGSQVTDLGFMYVLSPVLANTLLLLAMALILNNMFPNRRYPAYRKEDITQRNISPTTSTPDISDIDWALKNHPETIEVAPSQVLQLMKAASQNRQKRLLGQLPCRDFIDTNWPYLVENELCTDALRKIAHSDHDVFTVVDRQHHVLGHVARKSLLRHEGTATAVGRCMSSPIQTLRADSHAIDASSTLRAQGLKIIPVVDSKNHYLGMIDASTLETLLDEMLQ